MLGKIMSLKLLSILFLVPLLFWTITPNFFLTFKLLYVVAFVILMILNEAFHLATTRSLRVSSSNLTSPLVIFATTLTLNLILIKEGRMESIIGRYSIYIVGAFLAYFASYLSKDLKKSALWVVVGSTTVLALHSLMQLTFLHSMTSLPVFMQTRSFTLTGSPLLTLALLLISTPSALFLALRSSKSVTKLCFGASAGLSLITAIAYLSLMMPGGELAPLLLSYGASWSIALDAMKNLKTILFGVGLANYSSLYTVVKPLSINTTALWNATSVNSTSELMQILTTTGITGLLSFLLLAVYSFRPTSHNSIYGHALDYLLWIAFASFIFLPATLPIVILFFLLLGIKYSSDAKEVNFKNSSSVLAVVLFLVASTFGIVYFFGRLFLAESYMRQAQIALAGNDGKKVYEYHLKAVTLFPTLTSYRISYSSVNLSLAAALSSGKDLTQADRDNITQLVSQAVREARAATSLRPSDATTWSNLGYVYKNLINVADGADNFAVQAYAQAITLDAGNPALRVDFGGLLYQLGVSEKGKEKGDPEKAKAYLARAAKEFQTAATLKSDYANAFYLMGKSYEALGDTKNAVAALEAAQGKVVKDSSDYTALTKDLETLKESSSATPGATTSLAPSPLPSPIPGGEIPLPSDSPTPGN